MGEKTKGIVTIVQLVSWGLALTTTTVGIFWAKIASTDNEVDKVKVGQAKLEEAIATLKEDNKEIKQDVKELLKRIK